MATNFDLDMQEVFSANCISSETKEWAKEWAKQSVSITAQSTSMDLSFACQNTLGELVDNVFLGQITFGIPGGVISKDFLIQTTSVPELSTFAIFFTTGFGLFFIRRRKPINS